MSAPFMENQLSMASNSADTRLARRAACHCRRARKRIARRAGGNFAPLRQKGRRPAHKALKSKSRVHKKEQIRGRWSVFSIVCIGFKLSACLTTCLPVALSACTSLSICLSESHNYLTTGNNILFAFVTARQPTTNFQRSNNGNYLAC